MLIRVSARFELVLVQAGRGLKQSQYNAFVGRGSPEAAYTVPGCEQATILLVGADQKDSGLWGRGWALLTDEVLARFCLYKGM